jgi:hypothetical protein
MLFQFLFYNHSVILSSGSLQLLINILIFNFPLVRMWFFVLDSESSASVSGLHVWNLDEEKELIQVLKNFIDFVESQAKKQPPSVHIYNSCWSLLLLLSGDKFLIRHHFLCYDMIRDFLWHVIIHNYSFVFSKSFWLMKYVFFEATWTYVFYQEESRVIVISFFLISWR